jgi:hypothetical protein
MFKFGWPVKPTKYSPSSARDTYPSPSPYQEQQDHASPVAFPSTTPSAVPTTVTNTTTTTSPTTHFLTLPIWKRHEQPVTPLQRMSMFDLRTHQAGLDHQRKQGTPSPRDKSLPPTPTSSNEDVSSAHMRSTDSPIDERSWLYSSSTQTHSSSSPSPTASPPVRPTPSNAKFALAQAALAIGLPHGMPKASASSSRTDVNSTAFVSVPPPSRQPVPRPNIRRAKSFQQLSWKFFGDDDGTSSDPQRPRSRGASFDPARSSEFDGRGKGNALDHIPSHVTPPRKSLVRRASFWNRKRNDTPRNDVAPSPSERPRNSPDNSSPLLPTLRPMSPLHFDTSISRSSPLLKVEDPLPPSPPGLDTRDEARHRHLAPNPSASSPNLSIQTLKKPTASRQRPSTADPAADRSRTLPYYQHLPDHSSPLAAAPSQQSEVATPQRTTRPRSQTNPLHRLSANLFSFGSSSLMPSTDVAHINQSPTASPRPSTSKLPPPKPRANEESPATYVDRLLRTISKADVASVLASRYDRSILVRAWLRFMTP